MAKATRRYSSKTIKLLFGSCGNECAEPTCTNRIIAAGMPYSDASEMGAFELAPNLLGKLREQELRHARIDLSKKLGLAFSEVADGKPFAGIYRQSIELASGIFAIIENAKKFSLVPWQASMEKVKAKRVSVDGARGPDLQPTTGLSR